MVSTFSLPTDVKAVENTVGAEKAELEAQVDWSGLLKILLLFFNKSTIIEKWPDVLLENESHNLKSSMSSSLAGFSM